MSTSKVTAAVDEVSVKTPGALIVAFKQSAGDKTAVSLASKLPEHYITQQNFYDNIPSIPAPSVVSLTSSQAQDYDYAYPGDVTSDTLEITAYQDVVSSRTGLDVQVPYPLYFELNASNNHILLVRSDIADIVKVIIKP
jgi:hypothetical protein